MKITNQIVKNVSISASELVSSLEPKDGFSLYREKYLEYLSQVHQNNWLTLDLNSIRYQDFLSVTGQKLESFVSNHGIRTIVIGISGDLDSSFNLLSLSRIVKERALPLEIVAYNFKSDFQPKRVARIESLINYLNKNLTPIKLFSYDLSTTSSVAEFEMSLFENEKIKPRSKDKVNSLIQKLKEVSDNLILEAKNPSGISRREKASLVHEISTTIKGRLLRRFPRSMLIGSINATEICISNFTTSDLLVGFNPLIFLQKKVIARMFTECINESQHQLQMKDWEFSINRPSGFYPSKIKLEKLNGKIIFSREVGIFNFLGEITIDPETSKLSKEFWDSIIITSTSFEAPGKIQYFLDEHLFNFLIDGISNEKINALITEKHPFENEVLLSAIIYLTAREMTIKDMYVAKMAG